MRAAITFTPHEEEELRTFPPGYRFAAPLSPDQLELRRAIGHKYYLIGMSEQNEWWATRPEWVKEAFVRFPAYEFYTTPDGRVRRLYGFCETEKGEKRAHVVTGMILFNNDVVGGIPFTELIIVKGGVWTAHHLARISMSPTPWLFYDPLAYLTLK